MVGDCVVCREQEELRHGHAATDLQRGHAELVLLERVVNGDAVVLGFVRADGGEPLPADGMIPGHDTPFSPCHEFSSSSRRSASTPRPRATWAPIVARCASSGSATESGPVFSASEPWTCRKSATVARKLARKIPSGCNGGCNGQSPQVPRTSSCRSLPKARRVMLARGSGTQ